MVLHIGKKFSQALREIGKAEHKEFLVYEEERERTLGSSDEIIQQYGEAKWDVVEAINKRYHTNYNLHHWLQYDEKDEVSYFINEVGSNTLNYSEYKAPWKFHVWLGEKGFIIGVEQKGKGFNATEVDAKGLKENEGVAFTFFRKCQGEVFFDNPNDARVVYFLGKIF